MSLNESLRLLRVFHDKQLIELAKDLNISPGYLSGIESNKKKPSIEIIKKYADIFQTTPSAILFFSEELASKKLNNNFKFTIRNKMLKLLQTIEEYGK